MRKIPFAGIELTSQRVRGLRGTSELPGRPATTIFNLYGCSTRKLYFHILVLDFGHWSVRDYVPFRHQIFGPNCLGRPFDTYSPVRLTHVQAGNRTYLDIFAGTIYPLCYLYCAAVPACKSNPYIHGHLRKDSLFPLLSIPPVTWSP